MVISAWQQPHLNIRRDEEESSNKIQLAVIKTRHETIWISGDARKPRTAGFGFDFQIKDGLWGLCATTVSNKADCMVGSCFDGFLCTTGCGYTTRTNVNAITW